MTELTHVIGKDGNVTFTLEDGTTLILERSMIIEAAIKVGINIEELLQESEQCQTSSSKLLIDQVTSESIIVP